MSNDTDSSNDTLLGRVLGGSYKVDHLIGEGGMGSVYEATHTRVDRLFAIKVLNIKLAQNKEAKARFEREAMIGSRLGHDHIVAVMDFDYTDEGFPFLVMERLNGVDLSVELKRHGALPLERAASVIRQVGVALAAAHEEGVVHRDLKPENIFLCRRQGGGELVKVMDFGISKVLTSDSILTSHATVLGTPWYMAPEQAEGKVDKVDLRADVFALGAILYHMCAGEMPFKGDNVPSVLFQVVHGTPTPLPELSPDVDPGVVRVIDKAMSKRRADRYQTAAEMVDDLAAVLGERWWDVLLMESSLDIKGPGSMPAVGTRRPSGEPGDGDIALGGTVAMGGSDTAQPSAQVVQRSNSGEQDRESAGTAKTALPEDLGSAATMAGEMATADGLTPSGNVARPLLADSVQQKPSTKLDSPAAVLDSLKPSAPLLDSLQEPARRTTLSRGSGEVRLKPEPPLAVAAPPGARLRWLALAAGLVLMIGAGVAISMRGGGDLDVGHGARSAPAPGPASAALPPTGQQKPAARPAPPAGQQKPAPGSVPPGDRPPETRAQPGAEARAETRAVAKVSTRSLTVHSNPAGARVTANGKLLGKTPLVDQIVLQQAIKLRIHKPGFSAAIRKVIKGAEPRTFKVTLHALKATLNVVALDHGRPVSADIYLNGRKVDQTPAELSELKPGKYKVQLKCSGYVPVSKMVTLRPGKQDRIAVGLTRRK